MITKYFREHDGDCYFVEIPDFDEIKCECERIVLKDESFECDICRRRYCPSCGKEDYKNTGWFVCNNCLEEPELIIDALIKEL
jgi:hypothetical protein